VGRLHDTPEWVGICTPEDLDVLNRLEMAFSLSAELDDFSFIIGWQKPNREVTDDR